MKIDREDEIINKTLGTLGGAELGIIAPLASGRPEMALGFCSTKGILSLEE